MLTGLPTHILQELGSTQTRFVLFSERGKAKQNFLMDLVAIWPPLLTVLANASEDD